MRDYVRASQQRIVEARRIADQVRSDPDLHRLAMNTVFLLEDCHESFVRLLGETAYESAPEAGAANNVLRR